MVSFPLIPRGNFEGAYDASPGLVHVYEIARRTLKSYTGKLVRLRRTSDNAEKDFGYLSNGDLNVTAIAEWAGGTSVVVTIYDQALVGDDITNGSAANQPAFTASAQNGHAGITFDGTDNLSGTFTNGGALSQPVIYYAVAQLDAGEVNNSSSHCIFSGIITTAEIRLDIRTSPDPDTWRFFAGSTFLNPSDATTADWYVWSALGNGASCELWQNGSSLASGSSGVDNPTGLMMGAIYNGGQDWKGLITTIVIADPSHTTAQRQAMESALNDYWGVY